MRAAQKVKREMDLAADRAAVVKAAMAWDAARTAYRKAPRCPGVVGAAIDKLDVAEKTLHAACAALAQIEKE
jgi:hypothetical protein